MSLGEAETLAPEYHEVFEFKEDLDMDSNKQYRETMCNLLLTIANELRELRYCMQEANKISKEVENQRRFENGMSNDKHIG
jgi:ribulose bisphosphate carboxylase small subunit